MEKAEILKTVNEIFINTLDDENIVLNYGTTANDVDEWDSLNHIQLIVAIEKWFKIRFASQEILNWNNVGDIVNDISSKFN